MKGLKCMKREAQVVVTDEVGLHVRTAAAFAGEAQKYDSKVKVYYKGKAADAKSMLSIMTLGVKCGEQINIMADGTDAEKAVEHLKRFVENNFET
jgi:phosphocarrier protein HPr